MDRIAAQSIIYHETEDPDGFLFKFAVGGTFLSENWQHLQAAIHAFADSMTDDEDAIDRRTAGDLHYLTEVLTMANMADEASSSTNAPLEAATSALWEYNHRIFSVPQNRSRKF